MIIALIISFVTVALLLIYGPAIVRNIVLGNLVQTIAETFGLTAAKIKGFGG